MTTKLIGLKEFRTNISTLWKQAQKQQIRYIVLHHTKPILEINPIPEQELILEKLTSDIKVARAQAKRGQVYTQAQVRKLLGL